ncbi:MAG TPA: SDR family NAD(P)-dependent oxidoreductase [Anaerolineales bacterium]|nr:SDR family NAD(P)-dependent oxidoreductase [Anaerolineales bacterium]
MIRYWNEKQVFVSGAGGFIGSHLVEELARRGARVRAFLHYNSRNDKGLLNYIEKGLSDRVEPIFGDLRDLSSVTKAMKGCSHVFHLGAHIGIPYSYANPADVVATNVNGTMNTLLAARDLKVERVVHTSTSEVYGTAIYAPIDEKHPLQGQSPYSASKIGADKIAESFYRSFNLPVVTIRPFNTFGPRQSARAVIPTIISQVIKSEQVSIGNLDSKRDFTFVSDTVEGFLKCGQTANIEGETINLGTGVEVTIGELLRLIIEISGKEVKIVEDHSRYRPEKSEVQRLLSENKRAREIMGWEPQITLSDGLKVTYDWVEQEISNFDTEHYVI